MFSAEGTAEDLLNVGHQGFTLSLRSVRTWALGLVVSTEPGPTRTGGETQKVFKRFLAGVQGPLIEEMTASPGCRPPRSTRLG